MISIFQTKTFAGTDFNDKFGEYAKVFPCHMNGKKNENRKCIRKSSKRFFYDDALFFYFEFKQIVCIYLRFPEKIKPKMMVLVSIEKQSLHNITKSTIQQLRYKMLSKYLYCCLCCAKLCQKKDGEKKKHTRKTVDILGKTYFGLNGEKWQPNVSVHLHNPQNMNIDAVEFT